MSDRVKLIVGLILLAATVAWGIWQFQIYRGNIASNAALQEDILVLTEKLSDLKNRNEELQLELSEARESANQEYAEILPSSENVTDLNRLFDDFAAKNNFSTSPIFINNLSYQKPVATDFVNIQYTPATLSFTGSKENLEKLIYFIENSGSLESGARLMTLEEVTITYPETAGEVFSAKLLIHVYFSSTP